MNKKVVPEFPTDIGGQYDDYLANGTNNYGDYTDNSKRLTEKYYQENTNSDILDPFNNQEDLAPYLKKSALAIPKSVWNTIEHGLLNVPSYAAYGTGLLAYGADYAMGGIEEGKGEMDYYDYVPHAEIDLARGRVPYQNMGILKPWGTVLRKGFIDTPREYGKILFDEGLTEEAWTKIKNTNPWLTPNSTTFDKTQAKGAPNPESIQNTLEWGMMGLAGGQGYFAKIPVLTKLMMNKQYVASGLGYGLMNSTIKEVFDEEAFARAGTDSVQTMALVGLNLLTDLGTRKFTSGRDHFMKMGLTQSEAKSLEKELPNLQRIVKESLADGNAPLQSWQLIQKQINSPGLKAYLRLMAQSDPRFKQIISDQFVNINQAFDKIFDSALMQSNGELSKQGRQIFDGNIDIYAVAQRVMSRYGHSDKKLNEAWRADVGIQTLNKQFNINEVSRLQETIQKYKQTTQYKGLAGSQKIEMDSHLLELMNGDNQTLNKMSNLLTESYDKFRVTRVGEDIKKGEAFSPARMQLSTMLKKELGDMIPSYKQANENYASGVNKFIESTPAYITVNKLKKHINANSPEEVVDTAIEAIYNPKLTVNQLDQVLDMLDEFGGNTLVPELLRIKIQQEAKRVFKASDDVTSRATDMTKNIYKNKWDQKVYRTIVARTLKDKTLKDNESALIVNSLLPYFEQSARITPIAGESMTGLFTQFQKDMGVGRLKTINPLEWSQAIKDKYMEWNIQKMGDLFTDPNFLPLILDLKRQDRPQSFINKFITNYVTKTTRVGTKGSLSVDEYSANTFKEGRSNAIQNALSEEQYSDYSIEAIQ